MLKTAEKKSLNKKIGSFKFVPITEDDTLMSKGELDAVIKQGLENIKSEKTKRYTIEELRVKNI
ncbi:MAG TPA: hypothetical protein DDZ96_05675 [Porphyromonadaceae bacterium]|jgi:hypothetical protein|nr:hypothetical protein [Porphyromonadaceae bacterium]HBX19419.1 hypothetical protein [Porphyromonadaceae bacterium]HCM22541.1 hypothetical protein [Porphyromonadaceae bacterium]